MIVYPPWRSSLLALGRGRPEGVLLAPPAAEVVAEEAVLGGGALDADAGVRRVGGLQFDRHEAHHGGVAAGEVVDVDHPVEHPVAAFERPGLVGGDRVVGRRGLHEAGEHGRLLERQIRRGLGEVDLRGGEDPVRVVPEVGLVEVPLEDLVLGELLLDGHREAGLGELAAGGLLGGGDDLVDGFGVELERAAHVLHGDGGGALLDAAGGVVGDEGAHDAAVVDAVVLVEPRVLGGDHGLLHDGRDLVEFDVAAELVVEEADEGLAVGGVDVGGERRVGLGDLDRECVDRAEPGFRAQARHGGEREDQGGYGEPGEQARSQQGVHAFGGRSGLVAPLCGQSGHTVRAGSITHITSLGHMEGLKVKKLTTRGIAFVKAPNATRAYITLASRAPRVSRNRLAIRRLDAGDDSRIRLSVSY